MGVAGIGVAATSTVGVLANVALATIVGFGVLGMAVGTLPTGLITFRTYVFATSKRQERRLFIAGIWYSRMASKTKPAPTNSIVFLFDMRESLPELDESDLISR